MHEGIEGFEVWFHAGKEKPRILGDARLLKVMEKEGLFGSGGLCLADEAVDGFAGFGTDGEPFIHFFEIDGVVRAFDHGIVGSELFDEATVAAFAAVDGDDFVVRAVFGALAAEAERN